MNQRPACAASLGLVFALLAGNAQATPFTSTSPVGGLLPSGVSTIGGIVIDLVGTNANRLVAQTAASSLFTGFPPASSYPLLIGTQSGFTSSVLGTLGGGLSAAAFRFTLYDGDNQAPDFDFNENGLTINGVTLPVVGGIGENWSAVATQRTDATGTTTLGTGSGFGDDTLDTGWFTVRDSGVLAALWGTLSAGTMAFRLTDASPGDQFYDFTRGIDASLIGVGTGPVVTPAPGGGTVPEPGSLALVLAGLGVLGWSARRRAAS